MGVACAAVALVGACACLLFGTLFGTGGPKAQSTADLAAEVEADLLQRIEEALTRIAADGGGDSGDPLVEPAPGFVPITPDPVVDAPTPPPGYEFVRVHGEMRNLGFADDQRRAAHPVDDPAWLTRSARLEDLVRLARRSGRDWSFGWVRLADDAVPKDSKKALEELGAEIVGTSGHLLRAKLPGRLADLERIASLSGVDSLAAMPPEAKLAAFREARIELSPGGRIPIFVILMSDDPAREWRQAMEALGTVVGRFDPATRVYAATASRSALRRLAELDFVHALEPIPRVQATLDTAVPGMGADGLRRSMSSAGLFSGIDGGPIPIGIADSGLNIDHVDLATNRASICGANFSWNSPVSDPNSEQQDLWYDRFGHGTHVTGTVVGNGYVNPGHAGMAPGIQHIRIAKVLDVSGGAWGDEVLRGMDFLATSSQCDDGGYETVSVKPEIVNMSLGSSSRQFRGRSASERKLDSIVWNHRQLYLVAHGNDAMRGFTEYSAAKNSLGVGAVFDNGDLAGFSSIGPTADGRLAPKLVGTGVGVVATSGKGSRSGYRRRSGTSMASPSVAGIAALLLHAVPVHRDQPALTRARLMASAIRPDAWLEDASVFPTHNTNGPGTVQALFGMGKASARPTILNRSGADGWTGGSATATISSGVHAYQNIVVPENTHRLDLVLTWDEEPADAIASTVLNDLDLWLDQGADCNSGSCGEYSSRSRRDNVEWIIVRNPPAGTYRAKIVPERIYAKAPRPALAWTVVRGPSRPTLQIAANKTTLRGAAQHELTLTLSVDGYLSSGTLLHIDCRDTTDSPGCAETEIDSIALVRRDGVRVDLAEERGWLDSFPSLTLTGTVTPLGEVAVREPVEIKLLVSTGTLPAAMHFTASSWNAAAETVSVGVNTNRVDSLRPANDDFIDATTIEGETGSTEFDLLAATPEPGEPIQPDYERRPVGSVWYTLHAPSTTPIGLRVSSTDVFVEVFEGSGVAALSPVASGAGGAVVFPAADTTYHVRASHTSRGIAGQLTWSNDVRPANDDFADAARLQGSTGSFAGSNRGATLETGEWFGTFAATTWHRWRAPRDGSWEFAVPAGVVVFVVEGEDLGSARLVSDFPDGTARLYAGAGTEYRIAVAVRGAEVSGVDYDLEWREHDIPPSNDLRAEADDLGRSGSSTHQVLIDSHLTVESDEPVETGIRSAWWVWEAPDDGIYTWHLSGDDGAVQKLRLTVFAEAGDDDIEFLDQSAPHLLPLTLRFEAEAGTRYWLCIAFAPDDIAAYGERRVEGTLSWGPSPSNDERSDAIALVGARGSDGATNSFATTESGEFTRLGGRASVWWTHEVPANGWVRFRVGRSLLELAITVYVDGDDGQTVVASSRWQRSDPTRAEVTVYLEAGSRYALSVGAANLARLGDFTLNWAPSDPPAWLHFDRHYAAGVPDRDGDLVNVGRLGDLAFHENGTLLYGASESRLVVLDRDTETGALTFVQSLPSSLDDPALAWDAANNRLIASTCGEWRTFKPVGSSPRLASGQELQAVDDPGNCADQIFLQPDGSYVYRVGSSRLDMFAVEGSGALRFADSPWNHLDYAVVAATGAYVYAAEDDEVTTFAVDVTNGWLTSTSRAGLTQRTLDALAISGDGQYLFTATAGGRAGILSLANAWQPTVLGSAGGETWRDRWHDYLPTECRIVGRASTAAGFFCRDAALVFEYQPGSYLDNTDFVSLAQPDRFNNPPLPAYGTPRDAALSPDGHHVYVSTENSGIVVFSRPPNEDRDDPDLVASQIAAEPREVDPGDAVALKATVENQGLGASTETVLRFHRSSDSMVSESDRVEGRVTVPALDPGDNAELSFAANAPTERGDHYYRACVSTVDGEFYTSNNCSDIAEVLVAAPDLNILSLSADARFVRSGETFSITAYVRNSGRAAAPATTIRYYRSTDDEVTSDDIEVATSTVAELAASSGRNVSAEQTAPNQEGTYYYGACVDSVEDEADVDNNCYDGSLTVFVD